MVLPCLSLSLSQEGQNVFHFNVFEQIAQSIQLKKSLSDESEISTFSENMFNGAKRSACQTLWWLFLFHYDQCAIGILSLVLFFLFSESWSPFS